MMKKINWTAKISLVFTLLTAVFISACGSRALDPGVELVNKTPDGLAIRGYDAVAYQTITGATRGKPEFEFVWKGAKWLFNSLENKERFVAEPEKYSPEYGGYCAMSVAEGVLEEGSPEHWKVVDGKLYLVQNGQVKEVWEKSQPELVKKGNENWEKMGGK